MPKALSLSLTKGEGKFSFGKAYLKKCFDAYYCVREKCFFKYNTAKWKFNKPALKS